MTSDADTDGAVGKEDAASGPRGDPPGVDTKVLLEFLYRLGQAYLACGEQTAKVELLLRRTATAYGMKKARVVAFPTAVFRSGVGAQNLRQSDRRPRRRGGGG